MAPADGIEAAAGASPLVAKYAERVDSQSAREQLAARLAANAEAAADATDPEPKAEPRKKPEEAADAAQGGLGQLRDFLTSREGQRVHKKVMRGVFGMLRKRL